jgi:hypothetical protein
MVKATPVTDLIRKHQQEYAQSHACGSLNTKIVAVIERLPGAPFEFTVETGCGKSTILLSNISKRHLVFTMDDRSQGRGSSVNYYLECPYARPVETVYGPTQRSLPSFVFDKPLNLALIDGPHAFPFPHLEYYYIYPHLQQGAYLIIDDINIPSVHSLYAVVREDEMFEPVEVVGRKTAILRRTDAPTFDPFGDGWSRQNYNRRRVQRRLPGANSLSWRKLSGTLRWTAKTTLQKLRPS